MFGEAVLLTHSLISSITALPNDQIQFFEITHPFHPLVGQRFELIHLRRNWGEYRVYFYNSNDQLKSLPADWTNIEALEPFISISAGRSYFRTDDLVKLVKYIEGLES